MKADDFYVKSAFLWIPNHLLTHETFAQTLYFISVSCFVGRRATNRFRSQLQFILYCFNAAPFSFSSCFNSNFSSINDNQRKAEEMSQIGRQLEAPRPLKSSIKQQQSLPIYQQQQSFEVNTSEYSFNRDEAIDLKHSLTLFF